jgi:hypothetical protein
MKRIYDVMQAMDTDPATFFKQVARGEIALIIESIAGEQLKPSLEFWQQVIVYNKSLIPVTRHGIWSNDGYGKSNNNYFAYLSLRLDILDLLPSFDNIKHGFFDIDGGITQTKDTTEVYLRLDDIYTEATANAAPPANTVEADQPNPIQAKGEYATKINQAIIDFEQSYEFKRHKTATEQGLILDWLKSNGFNDNESRTIKELISEHYGLTTSRKAR